MNIILYPIFTDIHDLTDHYYRLHWYLYPFREQISQVSLFYSGGDEPIGQVPNYLDPALGELAGSMLKVNVLRSESAKAFEQNVTQSSVVLLWQIDFGQPNKVPKSLFYDQVLKKKILRIDHNNERFAGSFYLKFAELFPREIEKAETASRQVFDCIFKKCKSKKGYLFGTGPNLSLVNNMDFSDGVCIACNSMVRNKGLLDRIHPPLVVIADPIFHAGPSSYAATFRKELISALDRYDSFLIVPLRDYHIYKTYLPIRFHDRIASIPYKTEDVPNLDLNDSYYVTATANVLTLFLLPLATTFFEEIVIAGCDGRPINDSKYFWGHDKASQFNDQMELIKKAHPAFFAIDYNDYYLEHCKILEAWLTKAEREGRHIENMTPSYIPALRERYRDPYRENDSVAEIIVLDPDVLNHGGHFLAYDDKIHEACISKGLACSVFGNVHCSSDIFDSRRHFEPVFSIHSWMLGNRKDGAKESDIERFSSELWNALDLRRQRGLARKTVLYMYTGSLPVAKAVHKVLADFDNVSAVICLFWTSFIDYRVQSYVEQWKSFVGECMQNDRVILSATNERFSSNFESVFGVPLSVAPHPSPTFSDVETESLLGGKLNSDEPKRKTKLSIVFPGGLHKAKGFDITASLVSRLLDDIPDRFDITVRAQAVHDASAEMKNLAAKVAATGCALSQGHLSHEQFVDLLKGSDIIVLPYRAPDFSERTSGLIVDALYLGKPVIVLENTWLSDFVERYHNGVIVKGEDYSFFKDAIDNLVDNFDSLVFRVQKARNDYFRDNSWGKFLDSVTNYRDFRMEDSSMALKSANIISNGGSEFSRINKATVDETKIVANLLSSLTNPSIMIDVGAHHGSALAPFYAMNWNVYAFEPDAKNRDYLVGRFGEEKNIVINSKAVAEHPQKNVSYFSSSESTGISGMLAFRETHKVTDTVDVTTIKEIVTEHCLNSVDFLKIDVEGYDFSVLKGVPWDSIQPDVIECEFEDAKTKLLGHTWSDICKYLVEKGYTVYVSEWHPIIRYGISHDWRGLKKYPCELEDTNAWGNLLAFRRDPGIAAMRQALNDVLKVKHPDKKLDDSNNDDSAQVLSGRESETQGHSRAQIIPPDCGSKKANRKKKRRILPRFSSYAQFAEWVQSRNLTLFHVGQFVMWELRFAKRHLIAAGVGAAVVSALVVLPLSLPAIAPYSAFLWGLAGLLLLSGLFVPGVSFLIKKMMEFAEREARFRQALKNQLQQSYQIKQNELIERLENQGRQQVELTERLESQSQFQEELSFAVNTLQRQLEQAKEELIDRLESQCQQQAELAERLESQSQLQGELPSVVDTLQRQVEQAQAEFIVRFESRIRQQAKNSDMLDQKVNQLMTAVPVFNYGEYQSFNRKLTKEQMEVLKKEWSRKLDLKVTPNSLAYLAHRIRTLESSSKGRLATSIEDMMLRVLVATAVKSTNLRVLEIGTLFGIGLAAIYDNTKARFKTVHLTAIDPLNGYYGKDKRDIVTDEVIDERVFRENLIRSGVPEDDWTLLQAMSTESSTIEATANPMHDVLIIDGDHSLSGVQADFANYLPAIKLGGYIIFDDYDAPEWPDVRHFIDSTVLKHPDLEFVGASWRSAVFRVVSKQPPAITGGPERKRSSKNKIFR